jgi:hypothetical protein
LARIEKRSRRPIGRKIFSINPAAWMSRQRGRKLQIHKNVAHYMLGDLAIAFDEPQTQ